MCICPPGLCVKVSLSDASSRVRDAKVSLREGTGMELQPSWTSVCTTIVHCPLFTVPSRLLWAGLELKRSQRAWLITSWQHERTMKLHFRGISPWALQYIKSASHGFHTHRSWPEKSPCSKEAGVIYSNLCAGWACDLAAIKRRFLHK